MNSPELNDRYNLLLSIKKELTGYNTISNYAKENGFNIKNEFHITIIGGQIGKYIKESVTSNPEFLDKIKDLIKKTDWNVSFGNLFYVISKEYIQKNGFKEKRESIIQLVDVPVLNDFYRELNSILGTSFDAYFPHVTLFIKTNHPDGAKEGIGIASEKDFQNLKPIEIKAEEKSKSPLNGHLGIIPSTILVNRMISGNQIKKIQLPGRPQVDTLITLFIINQFGKEEFGDILTAEIMINPLMGENENYESKLAEEVLCIDVGGGPFDHHGNDESSAQKATRYFGQDKNPALKKLLDLALRSEKGQGTLSQDPLDKAFGFDGTVMTLNKVHQDAPWRVIDAMFPIIEAQYHEAYKRSVEYPELLNKLIQEKQCEEMILRLGGKTWRSCIVHTTDSGFVSYLRAYGGGKFELVIQITPTGHINVLTRMNNGIDLSRLVYLVRSAELIMKKSEEKPSTETLLQAGRIEAVPEWYYDTITNSLLNGGIHVAGVIPTKISAPVFRNLLQKWQDIAIAK